MKCKIKRKNGKFCKKGKNNVNKKIEINVGSD
jgi:hypothetical protein